MNALNRNPLVELALKLYLLLAFAFIFAPIGARMSTASPPCRSAVSRPSGTRPSPPTRWSGRGCATRW